MPKLRRPVLAANQARIFESAAEAEKQLDRQAVGGWIPKVDICEVPRMVNLRIELPGVDSSDVTLTLQDGILRVQGIKREPPAAETLRSYYCIERRHGRFDRTIPIHWVVDARRARAVLERGVLIVNLPKLEDRRGQLMQVPIVRKKG